MTYSHSSYEECLKEVNNQSARKVPWWNKELDDQRKHIRREPAVHWRLCGDLKEIPETAGLHKLLAKDGTTGLGTLLKRDGTHSKSY